MFFINQANKQGINLKDTSEKIMKLLDKESDVEFNFDKQDIQKVNIALTKLLLAGMQIMSPENKSEFANDLTNNPEAYRNLDLSSQYTSDFKNSSTTIIGWRHISTSDRTKRNPSRLAKEIIEILQQLKPHQKIKLNMELLDNNSTRTKDFTIKFNQALHEPNLQKSENLLVTNYETQKLGSQVEVLFNHLFIYLKTNYPPELLQRISFNFIDAQSGLGVKHTARLSKN